MREETRCRHMGYSFRWQQGFFYMHHPTDRITHTTAFVTPVVEHWLEREISPKLYRKLNLGDILLLKNKEKLIPSHDRIFHAYIL